MRLALLLLLLAGSASAQAVRIKLGTLAPQGSTWHQFMQQMAADFSKASAGKVELKIYAGGTQGNEGEMVRKMSIGQLHAASITAIGLHEITPEPQVEDMPFLIDSYEEYDWLHEKLRGRLEEALSKKNYIALQWGEVGFVYLFSTEAYRTPADFVKAKVFTWNGDPGAEQAWKAAGFHPVVLSSTDLLPSLSSRMVNVVGESPLYAYTTHLFERANHMLDLHWGFLTGATVVRKDVWEKVPPDLRPKVLEIAEDYGKRTRADVRKQNEEAIEQMKKRGLQVIEPADLEAWQQAAERANAVVRGRVVPAALFDEVVKLRNDYRAQHRR
ncbi:MAG: C4-dicarboxylate ABC transporter substrate-binding protein [Deltaproteobacteria bacterium]|nr:MAG: C4-dicarboxylate ABC transporter substrate-binding protein [Deltaproteobacteria bacterium]